MGRSIVYCDKCGKLLREEDFEKGKASAVDNRSFCADCRLPPVLPSSPVSPPELILKGSSGRLKALPQETRRVPLAPAPPKKSSTPLVIGGVLAGVLVLVIAIAMSSGESGRGRGRPPPPDWPPPVPPPPPPVTNKLSPRDASARAALDKAIDVKRLKPLDLAAQVRAYQEAIPVVEGTPFAVLAERDLVALRRQIFDRLAALEEESRVPRSEERWKAALGTWEGARGKIDLPEWTQEVDRHIAEIKAVADGRFAQILKSAVEAKRRGAQAEVQKDLARVAKWGLPGYAADLEKALAGEIPDKLVAPTLSKAVETYRLRWRDAMELTAGRDVTEALKALERAAAGIEEAAAKAEATVDLENLELVAALLRETPPLLRKIAKGQKVALSHRDPSGKPARVDDVVLRIDAHRVEVKKDEGSVVILFGEIAAVSLGEIYRNRNAGKPATDLRAAAVLCLLEGDVEGARGVDIDEKYVVYAKERAGKDGREKEVRDLFYGAEADYFYFKSTADAVQKYKTLLADHAGTPFVRRNRAAIAARAEGGRDYIFLNGDLGAAGGFHKKTLVKVDGAWVSIQDLDGVRMKDSYVELEFSALPDTEYRCWIYAGGCCQEVFGCFVQATGLMGPDPRNPREKIAFEPGAATGLPVKTSHLSVKKLHSLHTGPKVPERFFWISVPLPKFTSPGAKKVRILTSQKGFAVAHAVVSALRQGSPSDLEIKEQEKLRAETPGASSNSGGSGTGSILREVWNGIEGSRIADLLANQGFKEDKPSESGLISSFESPVTIGDNYGTRIRGYVHPPVSGPYLFWISSDDTSELYLSSDEDPSHKVKIASVPTASGVREWARHASQQSQPVQLQAGRRYYIEALHKEKSGGEDHVAVGWQLPSGVQERSIPGHRLSPFLPARK